MNAYPKSKRRTVVLMILDGFGINPSKLNNAVAESVTPRFDEYFHRYPWTLLDASGAAAGLPEGQMGNSEVGHMTLGSGSLVRQDLVLIRELIADGSFFHNKEFNAAIDRALAKQRPVHLLGLVSDGGVHSHINHLLALIALCKRRGAKPLVHMITDGRDTAPCCAMNYLPALESALQEAGGGIATVSGRYFALDRDRRWDRVERAWRAMTLGRGRKMPNASTAIQAAYVNKEDDEFIQPCVIGNYEGIEVEDEILSFNFRKDRIKQILSALGTLDFQGFDRGESPLASITCMMKYDNELSFPYAYQSERPKITLNKVLADEGLAQLHCAETEKYAHVTYFFNGGSQDPVTGERHLLIPSPKVATYDMQPEMSAREVADAVVNAINSKQYSFILVNFANGDMVGHTGKRHAVLRAVEALDEQAGRVMDAAVRNDCSLILTADHGNCEMLRDPQTDAPHTQHTTFPVPCLLVDSEPRSLVTHGGLANVAPTVLDLMGIPIPHEMSHSSLLMEPRPNPYEGQEQQHVA